MWPKGVPESKPLSKNEEDQFKQYSQKVDAQKKEEEKNKNLIADSVNKMNLNQEESDDEDLMGWAN